METYHPDREAVATTVIDNPSDICIRNQLRLTFFRDEITCAEKDVIISDCRETSVYITGPVRSLTVQNCKDCEINCMLVRGLSRVVGSEAVTLRVVTEKLCVERSSACTIQSYTSLPIAIDDGSKALTVSPFNVVWSRHRRLLKDSGYSLGSSSTWMEGILDDSVTILSPTLFRLVHFPEQQNHIPAPCLAIPIPPAYQAALELKISQMDEIRSGVLSTCTDANLPKVNAILAGHFREWLTTSRKIRPLVDTLRHRI
jgi:hypothetical protein